MLPEREAADANFRLLLLAARTIKRTGKAELPLAYFSLWTVKLGGWLPLLGSCASCGKELKERDAKYFSAHALAMFCEKCRRPGARAITSAALTAARKMLSERLDRIAENDIEPQAAREITEVMLNIIEHQIDRKLASRELLESPA